MGAPDMLNVLRGMGLELFARGSELLVGPRSAITDEIRHLIRDHKPELLAVLNDPEPEVSSFGAPVDLESLEERAAIMEFEGGLPRAEAELMAWEQVQALMQRLNALEWLARYSPERLLQAYRPEQFPAAKLTPGPQFWEERERRGRKA